MPPTYFTVDSNLANLQAADKQFARFCVEPRLDTVTDHLTVLAQMCDPRLRFVHDPVVAEDEVQKQTVIDMRLRSGMTTINQENEEGKWPAFPEGDERWIDSSLKPMSLTMAEGQMAQEQHELGLKQGDQQLESGEQADELAADGHEHTKDMDKKKIAIDAKKASQKPAAARSLEERLEIAVNAIESQVMSLTTCLAASNASWSVAFGGRLQLLRAARGGDHVGRAGQDLQFVLPERAIWRRVIRRVFSWNTKHGRSRQ